MRTVPRRSQFIGILALWLAALLMGSSLAVVPQFIARAQNSSQTAAAKAARVSAPAEALDSRTGRFSKLRVSRTVPVRTEQFTVSGSISTKVIRTVTLQRLSGSKWVKVLSAKTSARGAFALPVTTTASSVRYRVSAAKTKVAGKTYPKVTSSSIRLRTVGLSPVSPMAGETVSISYAMDKGKTKIKRSVLVQRKAGSSWVTVGTGTVSRTGAVKATAVLTATSTLRIQAPKLKIKKKTYRATASKSFLVNVAPQSVALAMPATATVGQAVDLVVDAAPMRAGRTITIQQQSGDAWTSVLSGAQTASKTTLSLAPQAAGTMVYRAVMGDYHGASAVVSAAANMVVQPADPGAPVIAITSLNIGVSGTGYEAVLTSTGGTGDVTWSATGLPAGLSLSAAGVLSGTPTESGTFQVTFTATDESGRSGSQTISLTVNPAVSVATTALADGIVGSDYSLTLEAAGGTSPFAWTVVGLPAGLSFDGVDTITGLPTASGTSSVTVEVTDHNGKTDSKSLNLIVVDPMEILTTALDDGQVGDDYSAQILADGGDGTYTWAVTSGSLPAGLQLSQGGAITGTPTTIESKAFTVKATDAGGRTASAELALTINGLVVTTTDLPEGTAGQAYSQSLAASGGDGSYTWSVSSGTLPDGLTLASDGTLSGTPTAAASVEITFSVTDGKSRTAQAVIRVVVAGTLQVTTSSLAAGVVDDDYSVALAAAGGSGDYTWAATGLPDGIALVGDTLSGVPTAVGTSPVELTVTDGLSRTATATLSLVVGPAVSITTTSLPYALTSDDYSATLTATGGTSPYTWSATGLPEGLTVSSSSGALSGTADASAVGAASVVVTVSDAHHKSATTTVLLAVREPVTVTTSTLAEGTVGVAYSRSLAASGGAIPYTWSTTSALPDGVSLSSDGVLSGTPTATGSTDIEVKATDASDPALSATATLTLTVKDPVAITTTAVAEGTVDVAYTQTLATSGGTGPFAWEITAGSLPTGLELSTAGKISGTPTAAGSTTVALKVTDQVGRIGAGSVTVTVKEPVAITTSALAEGTVGAAYDATLSAEGGTAPYTWTTEAALPDGMTLSESGVLGGSPTTSASAAPVKVKVTDSVGRTASATLTIKIAGPLTLSTTSLANGIVDDTYSVDLEAAGGSGAYTWSASGLPSGVELDGAALTGTPTSAGSYQVSVSVSDEGGRTVATSFPVVIGQAVSVTTTSLPHAVTTVGYSATLTAAGGTAPYTWSSTFLPIGLELDSATGQITGIPDDSIGDTTAVISVTVHDAHGKTASATLSLDVLVPVAVVESSLPEATVGSAYDVTLTPGGGTAVYTWSTSSTLPDGMSFSSAGRLSGTPTQTGSFDVVVHVIDSSEPQLSGSSTLTLKVSDPLEIVNPTLPAGTVGESYEQHLVSDGGTAPVSWGIADGQLPAGLSLTTGGVISGTPTQAEDAVVTLRVTDQAGRSATREFTVVVKNPVSITTTSLPDGTVTVPYNQALAASGGDGAYTWSLTSGSLPAGLSLATDGTISGTPSTVTSATFTVKVTDATGRAATADLSLSVATPVSISTSTLASGVVGEAYDQSLSASGGVSPYTWQVTGMPAGLSVDSGTGKITGTPSESGEFSFSITATDAKSRMGTVQLAVSVAPVVAVTTASLPDGVAQANYSQTVAAAGGTAPYQWSATGLPTGLSINTSTGTISGKTAVTKSSSVTVTVTDAHAKSDTRELTLWVEGVEALSAGDSHTCALTSSGGVKCWGLNDHGQLGNGTTTNSSTPVQVTGLSSGVTQISASTGSNTCALLTTGAVKCWGWNADGQIGDGTTTDRTTPTQVTGLTSGVTSVSTGRNSTCAVVAGSAKCWGNNLHGGLGDNTTTTRLSPVQVSGLTSNVTSVSTGYQYACAVVSGAAKCWGEGDSARLGDGYTADRWTPVQVSGLTSGVTAIRTRSNHTCAVVAGAAKCWGSGTNGELGDNTSTNRSTPTQVSGLSSGVTAMSSGRFHTCAVQSGAAKCWGTNTDGQLGDSTATTRPAPIQVSGLTSGVTGIAGGFSHTCAVVGGAAYCWGLNSSGQLGLGNVTSYRTPQKVPVLG